MKKEYKKGEIYISTEEQKKIAEENHNLIYYFIKKYNVDPEEYYDLFAIDYLKCIKVWDKDKGKLPTLLAKALLNRVLIEKRRKRHTVSLSEVISCNEDGKAIVLEEIIKDKIDIEKIFEDKEELKFLMECEACRLRIIGYSQAEIGNKLGLSQSYISRIIKIRKNNYKKKNSAKHYSKSSIKI